MVDFALALWPVAQMGLVVFDDFTISDNINTNSSVASSAPVDFYIDVFVIFHGLPVAVREV